MMPSLMPHTDAIAVPPAVEATRWLALSALIAMIVLGVAWELWLAPLSPSGLLALKVVPLLFPLTGLWRRRLYTYRWLSLLVWFYFIEGVVRATSERGPLAGRTVALAIAEVVLCLVLFTACVLHVRFRLPRK